MRGMNWRRIVYPLAALAFLAFAWNSYGWPGVAAVLSGGVMWVLLHFNRMVHVMKQATDRPVGHVASAVMLNAKLRPGVNLLHIMALTKALGVRQSPEGEEPEVYRWTDTGGSHVTCEMENGRLLRWKLWRPEDDATGEVPEAGEALAPAAPAEPRGGPAAH